MAEENASVEETTGSTDFETRFNDTKKALDQANSKLDLTAKELEALKSSQANTFAEEELTKVNSYLSGEADLDDDIANLLMKGSGFDRAAIDKFHEFNQYTKTQAQEKEASLKEQAMAEIAKVEGAELEKTLKYMEDNLSKEEFDAYDVLYKTGKTGFLSEFAAKSLEVKDEKAPVEKGQKVESVGSEKEFWKNVDMSKFNKDKKYTAEVKAKYIAAFGDKKHRV